VVVVRRRTVIMVSVIVTTVGMHMDRRRPYQGRSHDDRHAGAEEPTHAESLSQHEPDRIRGRCPPPESECVDISTDQPGIL